MIEYDVFLSFSSADLARVRPIWQALSSSGLRVFWSDETLRKKVGQSFFRTIQRALAGSQHFILLGNRNSLASEWVQLEYETFFSNYHIKHPESRKFIILKEADFDLDGLPPFLRNLQVASDVAEILPQVGGVDVPALLAENERLSRELQRARTEAALARSSRIEAQGVQATNERLTGELATMTQQWRAAQEELAQHAVNAASLRAENDQLRAAAASLADDSARRIGMLEQQTRMLNSEIAQQRQAAGELQAEHASMAGRYSSLLMTLDDLNGQIKDLKRKAASADLVLEVDRLRQAMAGLDIDYRILKSEHERAHRNTDNLKRHLKAFIAGNFTQQSLRVALDNYMKQHGSDSKDASELLGLLQ